MTLLLRPHDAETAPRFTESAVARDDGFLAEFRRWLDDRRKAHAFSVHTVPFADMDGWSFADGTGDLVHESGRFFSVQGLAVRSDYGAVPAWSQPIINQPEVGILGILVKEFDGVLHCLMQAKMEPGNVNTIQLSPTVQATRSNFSRVHRGAAVPYLDHFAGPDRGRVLVDVLQSEQGAWFYRKQNRNMVVEATREVQAGEDFRWLTLGQLRDLLLVDNLVNMDARTVLSCVPFAPPGRVDDLGDDTFRTALIRSLAAESGALHPTGEILSWFTEQKAAREVRTRRVPLAEVTGWHRTDTEIAHDSGRFFRVLAADVRAGNREVTGWTQPLVAPQGVGVVALLVRRLAGVLHVLVHARVEAGYVDTVEIGPTVQCTPDNFADLPATHRPRYLDLVLAAPDRQVRFAARHSEEGGRLYHACNDYLVIEVDGDVGVDVPSDYRWVTVEQLAGLLRHSLYLNVQARSLMAGLGCLW